MNQLHLRARRGDRRLKDVAKELSISQSALGRFERGDSGVLGPATKARVIAYYAALPHAEPPPDRVPGYRRARAKVPRGLFQVEWTALGVVVTRNGKSEIYLRMPLRICDIHGWDAPRRVIRKGHFKLQRIASMMQLSMSSISAYESGRTDRMGRSTVQRLDALYARMLMMPPVRPRKRFTVTWLTDDRINVKRGTLEEVHDRPTEADTCRLPGRLEPEDHRQSGFAGADVQVPSRAVQA